MNFRNSLNNQEKQAIEQLAQQQLIAKQEIEKNKIRNDKLKNLQNEAQKNVLKSYFEALKNKSQHNSKLDDNIDQISDISAESTHSSTFSLSDSDSSVNDQDSVQTDSSFNITTLSENDPRANGRNKQFNRILNERLNIVLSEYVGLRDRVYNKITDKQIKSQFAREFPKLTIGNTNKFKKPNGYWDIAKIKNTNEQAKYLKKKLQTINTNSTGPQYDKLIKKSLIK